MAGYIAVIEISICLLCTLFLYSRVASLRQRKWFVTLPVVFVWTLAAFTIFLIPHDIQTTEYHNCTHYQKGETTKDSSFSLSSLSSLSQDLFIRPIQQILQEKDYHLQEEEEDAFSPSPSPDTILSPSPSPTPKIDCSKPSLYYPRLEVRIFWLLIYWGSFVSTYFLFPFMGTLATAPDLELKAKLLRVLKENLILYSIMAVAAGIGLIVLLATSSLSFSRLLGIAMLVSNIFSLLVLMLFLGYGLAVIPRVVWTHGNVKKVLRFHVVDMRMTRETQENKLHQTLAKIKAAEEMHQRASALRRYVRLVVDRVKMSRFAPEYQALTDSEWGRYSKKSEGLTKGGVVDLNDKFKKYSYKFEKASVLYEKHVEGALHYQALLDEDSNYSFVKGSFLLRMFPNKEDQLNSLTRSWELKIRPWVLRVIAIFLAMLSLMVIWSELLGWTGGASWAPELSVVALIYHISGIAWAGQLIMILMVYLYMAFCVVFALYKLRLFELYQIVWHHQTDARSLIFSAKWTAQLTPMLAYNFLITSSFESGTSFQEVLKIMNVVPVVGVRIVYCLPLVLVVVILFTVTDFPERVLKKCCGITYFEFEDDLSDSQIKAGQRTLAREQRKREKVDGQSLFGLDTDEEEAYTEDEIRYLQSSKDSKTKTNRKKLLDFKKRHNDTKDYEAAFGSSSSSLSSAYDASTVTPLLSSPPPSTVSSSSLSDGNSVGEERGMRYQDEGDSYSTDFSSGYSHSPMESNFGSYKYSNSSPVRDEEDQSDSGSTGFSKVKSVFFDRPKTFLTSFQKDDEEDSLIDYTFPSPVSPRHNSDQQQQQQDQDQENGLPSGYEWQPTPPPSSSSSSFSSNLPSNPFSGIRNPFSSSSSGGGDDSRSGGYGSINYS